jgi:hypothetical protein
MVIASVFTSVDKEQFKIILNNFISLSSAVKCEIFSCSFRHIATQEMEVLEGSVLC